MDSFREVPGDYDQSGSAHSAGGDVACENEAPPLEIGSDERRMHVRAYNYWVSLLGGRDYPSIEDLEPADVSDFADHSLLLDFSTGRDDPATPYVGSAIRRECGLDGEIRHISDVPGRSLLSRLTDHYMQIIANRAPVGFEAEFINQRGEPICYRGILMPFSSDGDTIDFIYGVINWKKSAEPAPLPDPDPDAILELREPVIPPAPAQPSATPDALPRPIGPQHHSSWEDGPLHDPGCEDVEEPEVELAPDAALADRLWAARECADAAKSADSRTRHALYRALSIAYDFALAAQSDPEDYAELLAESGVKAQARAPMTPIVKLVFGIDYDKTRLTEFSAALSYARREGVESGGFLPLIETRPGGLKALVAAERKARRPGPRTDDRAEAARARLRSASPIALAEVSADCEFALVLTRRSAAGGVEAVALVDDEALLDRAIRASA